MIDLHIHSNHSDGSLSVVEILKKAEELGLEVISFADHENCNAYQELREIDVRQYFSGEIVTGIELKTQYNDGVIDVLGYGYDYDLLKTTLAECYNGRSREEVQEKQLREFYEYGKQYGLTLNPIETLIWDRSKEWASIVFYDEMKSHPGNEDKVPSDLWSSFKVFRKYYKTKGAMFYSNRAKYYPTLDEIAELIHNAGGIIFVAHIHEYTWMKDRMKELEEMSKKLDGVECYHNIFSNEQIEELREFCLERSLLMSGGSDYHGAFKPNVEIGIGQGNLNIPKDILENWKK